jgi:hypothetical protein
MIIKFLKVKIELLVMIKLQQGCSFLGTEHKGTWAIVPQVYSSK